MPNKETSKKYHSLKKAITFFESHGPLCEKMHVNGFFLYSLVAFMKKALFLEKKYQDEKEKQLQIRLKLRTALDENKYYKQLIFLLRKDSIRRH